MKTTKFINLAFGWISFTLYLAIPLKKQCKARENV